MKHVLIQGEWRVSLTTLEDTGKPKGAVLSHQGKVVGAIAYVAYQTLDVVPDGLFAPREGVTLKPAL